MKQLYISDPSEQKILVKEANRPGTLSNILDSVLGMLLGFCKKQNNASTQHEISWGTGTSYT